MPGGSTPNSSIKVGFLHTEIYVYLALLLNQKKL